MTARTLDPVVMPPTVAWADLPALMKWRQREHVSVIGPTGCGKSTLQNGLLDQRQYIIGIGTKIRDEELDTLIRRDGFKRIHAWPPPTTRDKVILWPKIRNIYDVYAAAGPIEEALNQAYIEGGWTLDLDEVWVLTKMLKLGPILEVLWSQYRSNNGTIVAGTQRPSGVPLLMYSSPVHLFLFRNSDKRDLDRLREIGSGADGSLNSTDIRRIVESLPKFTALYLNTRTGTMALVSAPKRS